jgi:AcrR family transcriptional regulator
MAKATGTTAGPRPPRRAAVDDDRRIIAAALAAIARDGWRRLSLAGVAAEAELPLLDIYRRFGSKQAILAALYRWTDEAMLAEPPAAAPDERPRDRIFDLLMRRFDALAPYKPGLVVLARELPADPLSALCLGPALLCSMRWTAEACGIAADGIGGAVAIRLIAAAYLATMRVWLRDDSPDLAPTMAALDRGLRRIERWLAPGRRAADGGSVAGA